MKQVVPSYSHTYLLSCDTVHEGRCGSAALHVHICTPFQQDGRQWQHWGDPHRILQCCLAVNILGIRAGSLVQPEFQDGLVYLMASVCDMSLLRCAKKMTSETIGRRLGKALEYSCSGLCASEAGAESLLRCQQGAVGLVQSACSVCG